MTEILKDKHGRRIGVIEDHAGKKVLKGPNGTRLGEFDGKYTKNSNGVSIGEGNLLAAFLSPYLTLY